MRKRFSFSFLLRSNFFLSWPLHFSFPFLNLTHLNSSDFHSFKHLYRDFTWMSLKNLNINNEPPVVDSHSQSSFIDPLRSQSSTSSLQINTLTPLPSSSTSNSLPLPSSLTVSSPSSSPSSSPYHERLRWYHTPYIFLINVTSMRVAGTQVLFRMKGETNLPCYPVSKIDCERSFQDFETLCSHLIKYNPYNILPGLPPPSARSDPRCQQTIERFLKRLILHPLISRDPTFVTFLSSPAAFQPYIPTDLTSLLPAPTWTSKFRTFLGAKPKDVDAYLEQAKEKTAEQAFCVNAMQKAIDKLSLAHKSLGNAYLDFSTKLQGLALAETNPFASRNWKDFSNKMQVLAQSYSDHAAAEASTMKNGLVVLSNTCSNYQQALEKRYYALTLYDEACRNTEKQKRVMERLRLSNQSLTSDKVTSSVEELESKHAIESKYRIHFKLASEFILRDQVNIEKNWVEDMDNLMNEWSRVYFEFEKKRASEVWIKDSIVV